MFHIPAITVRTDNKKREGEDKTAREGGEGKEKKDALAAYLGMREGLRATGWLGTESQEACVYLLNI